jgi:hypothetical protein
MAKKVLVSYLERNKVFTIPDTAREEGVKEVQFLKLEFLKAFNLADDITADVVFQIRLFLHFHGLHTAVLSCNMYFTTACHHHDVQV